MSAKFEKYWPIVTSVAFVSTMSIIAYCNNGILGQSFAYFIGSLSDKGSLDVVMSLSGIMLASMLTFLGLFMGMSNATMDFIKKDKRTFERLVSMIKVPIWISLTVIVSAFIFRIGEMPSYLIVRSLFLLLLVYDLLSTIRLLHIYFCVVKPNE